MNDPRFSRVSTSYRHRTPVGAWLIVVLFAAALILGFLYLI